MADYDAKAQCRSLPDISWYQEGHRFEEDKFDVGQAGLDVKIDDCIVYNVYMLSKIDTLKPRAVAVAAANVCLPLLKVKQEILAEQRGLKLKTEIEDFFEKYQKSIVNKYEAIAEESLKHQCWRLRISE